MSTAKDLASSLLAVLEEERAAIRLLDGRGVSEAALKKAEIAARLGSLPPEALGEAKDEIQTLRTELRRNGTLLAHARTCLRELTELAAAARGAPRPGPQLRARL